MPAENREENEDDVTQTGDLTGNLDARADKIARKYALSFQLTIIITLGVVFFLTVFGELPFLGVLYALLPCLVSVYVFNAWLTKTFNPFRFYEGYYQREIDRARARFSNQGGKESLKEAGADREKALKKVFIVHGHDEAALHKTARFVERLGFEAVVLKEQASGGRTVIEKLEDYTDNVDYVIVLMTPDDYGAALKNPSEVKLRVRQNVLIELGMMQQRYGRNKVCVMKKGEPEEASDLKGIITIDLDDRDAWKIPLAQELKHAGLEVDFDRAL
jgi:predicted nucleotide-binding protein